MVIRTDKYAMKTRSTILISATIEALNKSTMIAAERLWRSIIDRDRAEAAEARSLADFAAKHEWPIDAELDLIGPLPARVGADGTRYPTHHEPPRCVRRLAGLTAQLAAEASV